MMTNLVTKARSPWCAGLLLVFFLTGCAETQLVVSAAKRLSGSTQTTDAERRVTGRYKVGSPYQIDGVWYYPKLDYAYSETGIASWYGAKFHGKDTANGEIFDMNLISAAHRTLPMPSIVRVTNLSNGRSLKVRINDRGPYARGRIIDLSRRTAQLLGFEQAGTATVQISVLAPESRQLAASYGVMHATDNEPPPPVAAPRVAVTSAALPPPPGAKATPPPTNNHKIVAVDTAPNRNIRKTSLVPMVDDTVTVVPIKDAPKIFVQAGAFTRYDNANRLRARLSVVGQAKIVQVRVVDRPFFQVRFGPLESVEEADRLLASVVVAGQRDARIVVE
jgi:rare lipoprotein A